MVGVRLFRDVRYFEHIRYFGVIVDLSQEISFTGVFLTIEAKFEFFTTCGTRIRWVPNARPGKCPAPTVVIFALGWISTDAFLAT